MILPQYPVDTFTRGWGSKTTQSDGLKLVPFAEELNQELLYVGNLAAGNYRLLMDGQSIADLTAETFPFGINMAELTNTPQYQQADQVLFLNEERFGIAQHVRDYAWMHFTCFQDRGCFSPAIGQHGMWLKVI